MHTYATADRITRTRPCNSQLLHTPTRRMLPTGGVGGPQQAPQATKQSALACAEQPMVVRVLCGQWRVHVTRKVSSLQDSRRADTGSGVLQAKECCGVSAGGLKTHAGQLQLAHSVWDASLLQQVSY